MHCAFSMWCIAVNMVNPAASLDWLNNSEVCMWFVQYLRFFVVNTNTVLCCKHRTMCGGCSLTETLIVASYVNSLTYNHKTVTQVYLGLRSVNQRKRTSTVFTL